MTSVASPGWAGTSANVWDGSSTAGGGGTRVRRLSLSLVEDCSPQQTHLLHIVWQNGCRIHWMTNLNSSNICKPSCSSASNLTTASRAATTAARAFSKRQAARVMIMCTTVSEEAAASDILVGAQPRIRCWARTRSSSSELVDTATARRQQRVEDAARVGLQFPFRSERRGRGAPSVAMKWRDAGLCHRMSLSMRRIGGNLECHCCHRHGTCRQCH